MPQWPLTRTSLILAILRFRRTVGLGSAMSSMHETLPQSTHTKCGWLLRSCLGSRNSNLQTWSPSSVRITNSASARSVRFLKTVALSKPSGTSSSASWACVWGLLERLRALRTEMRAGVLRSPASLRRRRASLTSSAALFFFVFIMHLNLRRLIAGPSGVYRGCRGHGVQVFRTRGSHPPRRLAVGIQHSW